MSSTQVAVTLIVIVLLAVVVVGAVFFMRRQALRQRFGPEYDRVVAEQDGVLAAERELRARERKHAELELRPLSPQARAGYSSAWQETQARFVEAPEEAVGEAHELVTRLVAERGYPTEDYEEQLAHLSVEHARTLGQYRDANDIYERHQRGEASTEQLRQALVHYRALFADLLGEQPNGVFDRRSSAVTDRVGSERTEADRAEIDRADADRANADRAETDRVDADRAEADRADADRAEIDQAEADRAEARRSARDEEATR